MKSEEKVCLICKKALLDGEKIVCSRCRTKLVEGAKAGVIVTLLSVVYFITHGSNDKQLPDDIDKDEDGDLTDEENENIDETESDN